jgi:hypothetical protein
MEDTIGWLQDWYSSLCDGDWEHIYGVEINTLDNPGWYVKIDLKGTNLASRSLPEICKENNESDWFVCRVRDDIFEGYGGSHNLETILKVFRDWWERG